MRQDRLRNGKRDSFPPKMIQEKKHERLMQERHGRWKEKKNIETEVCEEKVKQVKQSEAGEWCMRDIQEKQRTFTYLHRNRRD